MELKIGHPELNWNETSAIEDRNNAARARMNKRDVVAMQRAKLAQKGFFAAAFDAIKDGWNA